ncbi:hypothetical protein [Paenibacillus sp. USHLN196]|uniref:hypothetical protein n=1 Tax=Paenibacillus sp. USHLN196 TaxID=3081291 RepID=UPI003019B98A
MFIFVLMIITFMVIVMVIIMNRDVRDTNSSIRKSLKETLQENMLTEPSYIPTQQYFNGTILISFDENQEKFLLTSNEKNEIISFKDIISCEIMRDDISISKTSRGSQLGGAIIGGALAGGVGAVIGGLSGSQKHESKSKSIYLKLVVDSLSNPIREIYFFQSAFYTDNNDYVLKECFKQASNWHDMISIIIRRNIIKFENSNSVSV